MDGLRQYIISVVAGAFICNILLRLMQNGFAKELIKLLCGVFLTFTIIRPMVNFDFSSLGDLSVSFAQNAEAISATGENMARNTMADIIKTQTEAYILDKASALNAKLIVDVTISDAQIPERAVLRGEISPHARKRMKSILESDLGITKENQIWTG